MHLYKCNGVADLPKHAVIICSIKGEREVMGKGGTGRREREGAREKEVRRGGRGMGRACNKLQLQEPPMFSVAELTLVRGPRSTASARQGPWTSGGTNHTTLNYFQHQTGTAF